MAQPCQDARFGSGRAKKEEERMGGVDPTPRPFPEVSSAMSAGVRAVDGCSPPYKTAKAMRKRMREAELLCDESMPPLQALSSSVKEAVADEFAMPSTYGTPASLERLDADADAWLQEARLRSNHFYRPTSYGDANAYAKHIMASVTERDERMKLCYDVTSAFVEDLLVAEKRINSAHEKSKRYTVQVNNKPFTWERGQFDPRIMEPAIEFCYALDKALVLVAGVIRHSFYEKTFPFCCPAMKESYATDTKACKLVAIVCTGLAFKLVITSHCLGHFKAHIKEVGADGDISAAEVAKAEILLAKEVFDWRLYSPFLKTLIDLVLDLIRVEEGQDNIFGGVYDGSYVQCDVEKLHCEAFYMINWFVCNQFHFCSSEALEWRKSYAKNLFSVMKKNTIAEFNDLFSFVKPNPAKAYFPSVDEQNYKIILTMQRELIDGFEKMEMKMEHGTNV